MTTNSAIVAGQVWGSSGLDIQVSDVSGGIVTYHAVSTPSVTFSRSTPDFTAWVDRVMARLK